MFTSLIRDRTQVKIYYLKEQGSITGTITHFFQDFGVIKIDTQNLVIPLSLICKIEILENEETCYPKR